MRIYLDTSAAMKLLVDERESQALDAYLAGVDAGTTLVASWLLHAELHCAANRHPSSVDPSSVTTLLATVVLVDVARSDLVVAPTLPGRLRSADGIHLATAVRVHAGAMLTYDVELADAAVDTGIPALQPGA